MLRRPNASTPAHKYLPCNYCYGFVLKGKLRAHGRRCPLNVHKSEKDYIKAGKLLMQSFLPQRHSELKQLMGSMRSTGANPGK